MQIERRKIMLTWRYTDEFKLIDNYKSREAAQSGQIFPNGPKRRSIRQGVSRTYTTKANWEDWHIFYVPIYRVFQNNCYRLRYNVYIWATTILRRLKWDSLVEYN